MKEIYQQTVEEVLERNLQKERRKVSCRFSLKELSISDMLLFLYSFG